ncbi:MAG TPA: hypothetical protein VGH51_15075 [Candidatus Angelobacter sp.]|jgi:hypothetical protein
MDSVERLTPAALKESAKLKALALISDGYVQADDNLLCPICGCVFYCFSTLKTGRTTANAGPKFMIAL